MYPSYFMFFDIIIDGFARLVFFKDVLSLEREREQAREHVGEGEGESVKQAPC